MQRVVWPTNLLCTTTVRARSYFATAIVSCGRIASARLHDGNSFISSENTRKHRRPTVSR